MILHFCHTKSLFFAFNVYCRKKDVYLPNSQQSPIKWGLNKTIIAHPETIYKGVTVLKLHEFLQEHNPFVILFVHKRIKSSDFA